MFSWGKYVLRTFLSITNTHTQKMTVVRKQQLRKHLIKIMWICLHQLMATD